MPLATISNYFLNKARLWRSNGSSQVSVAVNLLWLALAWLLLPLESKAFTIYRSAFKKLYPQIDPDAPKGLDCLRWFFQTVYLICFKVNVQRSWVANAFILSARRIADLFSRLGDWVGYHGALLLDGNHGSFDTIDKKGESLSRPVKLTLITILGSLAAALAVLCITQPFNIQGQVVFLSVMLLSSHEL